MMSQVDQGAIGAAGALCGYCFCEAVSFRDPPPARVSARAILSQVARPALYFELVGPVSSTDYCDSL